METSNTKRLIVVVATVIIILAAVILVPWKSIFPPEQKTDPLKTQSLLINRFLRDADFLFTDEMLLGEYTDEKGNPYLAGLISPELDALLGELAATFNEDPTTTHQITEEELRRWLTVDIVRITAEEADNKALKEFIVWTNTLANLVYRTNVLIDGQIVDFAGSPVLDPPTNYRFIAKKNTLYKYYTYSWRYGD